MKSVKNFLKNRKGSALAITAVMMVVLALLVSVLLTCASYALNHAYAMYARQQAYFSARSAVIQFKKFVETGEPVETKDGPKIKPYTNFNSISDGKKVITATVGSNGNADPHFGEVTITLRKVNSVHSAAGNQKYKVTAVGTYNLGDKSYQNAASVYVFDDYKVEFKGNRNMVSSGSGLNPNPNGQAINIISLDYDKTLSKIDREEDTMTHMYSPSSFTYTGQGNSTLDGYVIAGVEPKDSDFDINKLHPVTVKISKGSGNAAMPTMLGAYVNGNITFVQGGVYIDGDVYCSGNFSVDGGNGFTITGDLYVGGNCTFNTEFKVGGSLYVGGAFKCGNTCSVGLKNSGATLFVAGSADVNNDFKFNSDEAIDDYVNKGSNEFKPIKEHMKTVIKEKIHSASSSYKVKKQTCDKEYEKLNPLNFKYDKDAKCIYIDESGILTADLNDPHSNTNAFFNYMYNENHYDVGGREAGNYFKTMDYGRYGLVVDTGCKADGTQKTIVLYVDNGLILDMTDGSPAALFNNIAVIGDGQFIVVLGENAQIFGGNKKSSYKENYNFGYLAKRDSKTYADYFGEQYPYERALRRSEINPNADLRQARSYVKMDSLYNSKVAGSTEPEVKKQALKDIEPEIYILSPYPVSDPTRVKGYLDQLSRAQSADDGANIIDPLGRCSNIFMQGMNFDGYIVTSDHVAMEDAQRKGEDRFTAKGDSATAIRSVDIYGCVYTDHFIYSTSGDAHYTFIPADSKFKDNLITPEWIESNVNFDDTTLDPEGKKLPINLSKFYSDGNASKLVTTRSVSNKSNYNGVSSAFYAY